MSTLDNILADTRQKIDGLRAESAEEAREATAIAERMAEPTDAYRAMEAEERDLLLKLGALRDEMRTAASALDAMADEHARHTLAAEAAANAADHFEQVTLPHFARLLDGVPPAEALAATGLMPPKDIEPPCDCPPGDCLADPFPDSDMSRDTGDTTFTAVPADPDMVARVTNALPVATPPVPHAPADMTMPDVGPPVEPLPPAEPGQARHAAPRDANGTGRMRALGEKFGLVHPTTQTTAEQGDDQ